MQAQPSITQSPPPSAGKRARELASRIAASLAGGWIFVWGIVTLGIVLLLAAGMAYADARTLMHLLAFPIYLTAFCWTYAAASVSRAWAVLLGGGGAMTALAWWLARSPS